MRNNGSHNRPREAHVTSLSLRRRCPLTGDQSVPPNPPGEPCHYHAGPHRADRPDLRALMKFPTCCRPAIGYPTFTYLHGRGRDGRKPFTPLASNASSRFDRIFRPLFRNEACRRRPRKWREQRRRKWILINTHRFSRGNNGRLIDPMEIRRGNYEPRLPNLMNSNRWRKTRRGGAKFRRFTDITAIRVTR